ncbi:MAG: VOC family protein [Hyphomonadaceae bacterium]|nr:VOC family protein [Hyphomonadaceae bacterium]
MTQVSVRYIVNNVEEAIPFYVEHLGFKLDFHPGGFAVLSRGDLRLMLNQPGIGGAGRPDIAGRTPAPGGWNRFQIVVERLDEVFARLRQARVPLRTDIVTGMGSRQILVEDPSGNLIEILEVSPAP